MRDAIAEETIQIQQQFTKTRARIGKDVLASSPDKIRESKKPIPRKINKNNNCKQSETVVLGKR